VGDIPFVAHSVKSAANQYAGFDQRSPASRPSLVVDTSLDRE